jgi:hypothetical protein
MGFRKTAVVTAIGAVAVLSTIVGFKERTELVRPAPEMTAHPLTISLAPAVVMAKRPTLSEILDIVLHERPTAEELGGKSSGVFPAGSEEAHVAEVLGRYTDDIPLVDKIAGALVKEGKRRHVESSLLVGVLLTENPDLDPHATSAVGARGLMQVMPFHAGKWGCASRDLFDVQSNICHGVAVLADNLTHARNLPQALLGYNGCVRGTNTPDCRKYPRVVYQHARKGVDSTSEAFAR